MGLRTILAMLTLTALLTGGCEQMPRVYVSDDDQVLPEQPARGLVARSPSPLADVPMPIGFVMVDSRSRAYVDAQTGGRYVEHYYQGRAAKADTIDFYRRQLRSAGWQPRSEQVVAGDAVLHYMRGDETLEVRITDPRRVTTVQVTIRGRAAAPAAAPALP